MEERMITVVIPTYNRFDCMKYFFENCFLKYTGKLFTFEIHDSSEDDRVKEYIDANIGDSPILKYFKYDSSINGDVKGINAIFNVGTPYLYLAGDGVISNFNEFERLLIENSFENYLLIGLGVGGGTSYLDNPVECFRKCFVRLTYWGASILSNKVLSSAKCELKKYTDIQSPFAYPCLMFEGLATTTGNYLFFGQDILNPVLKTNPNKKSSGWVDSKSAIKTFCYDLYVSLLLLPDIYKNGRHWSRFRFFYLEKGFVLKNDGNLTWKLFYKYHYYIKRTVSNLPTWYFVLLLPKFCQPLCIKTKSLAKKILKKR